MTDLRYPIGKFEKKDYLNDNERTEMIRQITKAPANLRAAVRGLSDQQIDTSYRPGGWTIRKLYTTFLTAT